MDTVVTENTNNTSVYCELKEKTEQEQMLSQIVTASCTTGLNNSIIGNMKQLSAVCSSEMYVAYISLCDIE